MAAADLPGWPDRVAGGARRTGRDGLGRVAATSRCVVTWWRRMRRCRWSAGRGWATALTACCWSRRSWRPGWLTATDIHWAASTRDLVPAGQTEFAQDPVSGYTASDL